jgi:2'-5' RNA ligase
MRLFIAIDLDDAIRTRIARFVDGMQALAPEARWMKPESLHVTLKFIGELPDAAIAGIETALRMIAARPVAIEFRGCGFFPAATAPRVFWIGVVGGGELARLAAFVDEKMAALGIVKEDRAYTPHLTLARGGAGQGRGSAGSPRAQKSDRPSRVFQRLQEKLSALLPPEFGTMTAREFFLYRSELSAKGSKYTKLAEFKLSAV